MFDTRHTYDKIDDTLAIRVPVSLGIPLLIPVVLDDIASKTRQEVKQVEAEAAKDTQSRMD